MNANVITVVVVVAAAILNYLLTQPPGTFSPQTIIVLGAMSIGLTTLSRFLPSGSQPTQKVEITGTGGGPIETTPVATVQVKPDEGQG